MTTTVIGHDLHDEKQVKVLDRLITVEESGYTYEPDVRHSELIIKELGLQAAKSVATPVAEENYENGEPLDHERFKYAPERISWRRIVMICNSQRMSPRNE